MSETQNERILEMIFSLSDDKKNDLEKFLRSLLRLDG